MHHFPKKLFDSLFLVVISFAISIGENAVKVFQRSSLQIFGGRGLLSDLLLRSRGITKRSVDDVSPETNPLYEHFEEVLEILR